MGGESIVRIGFCNLCLLYTSKNLSFGVLSLDQFMDEAVSEDDKGFEPASPENLEETVMLRMIIQDLLKKIHEINPKYGRILDLICEDYTKGQILDELGLGKSQGYADIKAAQTLAKNLYFGE